MRILIAYTTTDGMTARIAARMAERAKDPHHAVVVADLSDAARRIDPSDFDAALVGGSVIAGHFRPELAAFIDSHRGALNSRPASFFSVGLSIASPDAKVQLEGLRLAESFPAAHGWTPDAIGTFAGALRFSRYGLLRRWMSWFMSRSLPGGAAEPNGDRVFTDWAAVDHFTAQFMERARPRLTAAGLPAPSPQEHADQGQRQR